MMMVDYRDGDMLHFETGYSGNSLVREKLYPLFEDVFGISAVLLKDFYRRGFWDPSYCPYTFFDGDIAVANASRFELPLMIKGRSIAAAGIQSVMTLPKYRHRGFMTSLFERMLEDIDRYYSLSLLFTKTPSLYKKFGFRIAPETRFCARLSDLAFGTKCLLKRLDLSQCNDASLLDHLLRRSTPVSYWFAPTAYTSSFYLNCYDDTWQGRIYYHPDWNAVLIFDMDPDTLRMYAILAEEWPTMAEIVQATGVTSLSWVVTDFYPDRFPDLKWNSVAYKSPGKLMIRGKGEPPIPIKYPEMAKF